jgi:hypothetical protein
VRRVSCRCSRSGDRGREVVVVIVLVVLVGGGGGAVVARGKVKSGIDVWSEIGDAEAGQQSEGES